MIPPEILKQVRRIEIMTRRLISEQMAGGYESTFRGRGMEFDEVREYQPGDEVRLIDWNVTARTGRPHIKRLIEERELTVLLAVDLSRSMAFGSVRLKQQVAAELCAVLAFSAIKHQDRVGLLLFSDRVERFIPPAKGSRHALRVIRDVLSIRPKGIGTDIPDALEYLTRLIRRRAVVFLISDFVGPPMRHALRLANRRHDLIALHLVDPRQEAMPPIGWVRMEDAETERQVLLDTSRPSGRAAIERWAREHREQVIEACRSSGVDRVEIRTDRPYVEPLLAFFHRRALRR